MKIKGKILLGMTAVFLVYEIVARPIASVFDFELPTPEYKQIYSFVLESNIDD
jgi:hypothetical protein